MDDRPESPTVEPSAFDTQQFRQQLLAHVKAAGGTAKVGGQDFIQSLVKTAFEALLEAEMAEHLGYDRHDPTGQDVEKGSKHITQHTDTPSPFPNPTAPWPQTSPANAQPANLARDT